MIYMCVCVCAIYKECGTHTYTNIISTIALSSDLFVAYLFKVTFYSYVSVWSFAMDLLNPSLQVTKTHLSLPFLHGSLSLLIVPNDIYDSCTGLLSNFPFLFLLSLTVVCLVSSSWMNPLFYYSNPQIDS
jgi:hypothetical protein